MNLLDLQEIVQIIVEIEGSREESVCVEDLEGYCTPGRGWWMLGLVYGGRCARSQLMDHGDIAYMDREGRKRYTGIFYVL